MIEMATLELHKDIISYDLFLYINPPDNCDLASFENININIWQKISVIRSTGSSMVFPIYKVSWYIYVLLCYGQSVNSGQCTMYTNINYYFVYLCFVLFVYIEIYLIHSL